jgi:hypothetical protein
LKVLVNPLVSLIWVAGVVFVFGVAVAAWPMRQPVTRTVEVPATLAGSPGR